jgi:hypothetical protein
MGQRPLAVLHRPLLWVAICWLSVTDLGFGAAMLGYGDVADVYLKNKEKLEILSKNNREKNREANVSDVKKYVY